MSFIFSALSEWINDDDSVLHRSVPILVLIVYSFSGAGIFYALEMSGSCTVDYWVSLWFVNTVITTIGGPKVTLPTRNTSSTYRFHNEKKIFDRRLWQCRTLYRWWENFHRNLRPNRCSTNPGSFQQCWNYHDKTPSLSLWKML